MAANIPAQWEYLRDYGLSTFALFFSNLMPTLRPKPEDLTGKTAIVTGANSGIGFEIALGLVKQNATLFLACRNQKKGEQAVADIVSAIPGATDRVKVLPLDTSSFSSVGDFAKHWASLDRPIDILVHNAGVSETYSQPYTTEGVPGVYMTNFLGSFLLTHLLETQLSASARVIFTASVAHYLLSIKPTFSLSAVRNQCEPDFHVGRGVGPKNLCSSIYENSKGMQIAFAKLLDHRWAVAAKESGQSTRKTAHSFSPGYTVSKIFENRNPDVVDTMSDLLQSALFMATKTEQGAATGVYLASTRDEVVLGAGNGGNYWERMTRRVSKVDMFSQDLLDRLWIRWEADAGIQWR